jgi:hypothetical protein
MKTKRTDSPLSTCVVLMRGDCSMRMIPPNMKSTAVCATLKEMPSSCLTVASVNPSHDSSPPPCDAVRRYLKTKPEMSELTPYLEFKSKEAVGGRVNTPSRL